MGGLVTGGGIGFMVRKYGLTIDNLLAAQVVLASGEIVTASATEHPDLFWAIRGGGGNVGIVTEFTFQLAKVPQVLGGVLALPATREAVRGYLETSIEAPEELTTIANIMRLPPAPFVPEERVGELALLIFVVYAGDIEDGQRALAPLRAVAEPMVDFLNPMPYRAIYDFTAPFAEPHSASIRMMFADDLSDGAIDAMLAAFEHQSSPYALMHLRGLGGAFGRVPVDATAFAHRERKYFVAIINVWLDWSEDRAPHEAWTEALWEAIRHEGSGVYVNFLEREGEGRIHDAYPGETWERLQATKTAYDPDNLFQFNQNIPPKA
jgi:FAD/FMN-containing dehydrogenase